MLEFDVHSKQRSLGLFALIFKFDALFVEPYIQKRKPGSMNCPLDSQHNKDVILRQGDQVLRFRPVSETFAYNLSHGQRLEFSICGRLVQF